MMHNMFSRLKVPSVILFLTTVCLSSTVSFGDIVPVYYDDGTKSVVDNYYTPTKQEMYKVNQKVYVWYVKNRKYDQQEYVNKAIDYICENTKFEYGYVQNIKNNDYSVFSPYTFLTTKKMVCMGYTMLFQKFLRLKGIINHIIHNVNTNHVYNSVKINGVWQDIDVTHIDEQRDNLMLVQNTIKAFVESGGK